MNESSLCSHCSNEAGLLQSSALTHPVTNNTPEMETKEGWFPTELNLMPLEAFKGLDAKMKEAEGRSCTSCHIPPSLCSVILPYSNAAPLIASAFSKGRSISSGRFHISA